MGFANNQHPAPDDPFRPPEPPVRVRCLHCDQEYGSSLIRWIPDPTFPGGGFWACPTQGCDGAGFGFDILPTDPNYHDEHGGWVDLPDEDDDPPFDSDDDLDAPASTEPNDDQPLN